MQKFLTILAVSCLTASLFAVGLAQAPVSTSQTSPSVGKSINIPDGAELAIVTAETISSKTATEGDPINFRVDEDLIVDGTVAVAKGTIVKGTVSAAKKSGFFGRGGNLSVRIESTTTVDGQKLRLRAAKGRDGDNKTGTTVALVVLFGPLGFLKKGKNAEIKEGTRIPVFTDEAKVVHAAKAVTP